MPTLPDLLGQLTQAQGESLQLRPDQPPIIFVDRQARTLAGPPLTGPELEALLGFLLDPEARVAFDTRGLVDGMYEVPQGGVFAWRIRRMPEGPALAFRPTVPPTGLEAFIAVRPVEPGPGGWPTHSIEQLLKTAWQRGASDIILSSGYPSTVRVAGDLIPIANAVFNEEAILASLGAILTEERRRVLAESGSLDLALELTDANRAYRFRANVFKQIRGLAAAFRPIWDKIPERESLRLPAEIMSVVDQPHGLILVVGPTGSGKSTTLAVLLEHINRNQARHIITLEDPVEHIFKPSRSLVHQREVGLHVDSFSTGLRAALRECPDVILVGEMRDLDTIGATLTAAETGHLVLSTLHSGSANQAIDRMIDVFPQHQQSQVRIQLSDVLRCVITQRLLPTVDGKGRVPVLEIVRINYAFANMIRDKKTHLFASQIQTTQREGNLPFDLCLSRQVKDGIIGVETAIRAAHDPQYLRMLLGLPPA